MAIAIECSEPQEPNSAKEQQHANGLELQSRTLRSAEAGWISTTLCWWWEVGGAIVSAICVSLVLITLVKADGLALAAWSLPIQPNSLIAVFTTIAKSAMMVPIAGCLSQLSWQHFRPRPQPLDHLRVFDDASRGPWGAVELLFIVRRNSLIARMLAIATILALGIEPFTQQILDFGSRESLLTPATVDISTAKAYKSLSIRSGGISTLLPPTLPWTSADLVGSE